MEKDAEL